MCVCICVYVFVFYVHLCVSVTVPVSVCVCVECVCGVVHVWMHCCVDTAFFSPLCLHPPPVSLAPVVQYSLFLALKRLHGADEEAATALYHHWSVPHTDVCVSLSDGFTLFFSLFPPSSSLCLSRIVRYYSTFDLPVKPNKPGR